jgi:FixJ family two-component response regulator
MSEIIHVDSSGFFRKIMKAYLSNLGLESESYDRGHDALYAAKLGNVSCVITAMEIVDMSGEELVEQLSLLEHPVSIIVFSSTTNQHRLKYLEELGVVGIVQKSSDWKEELHKFFR